MKKYFQFIAFFLIVLLYSCAPDKITIDKVEGNVVTSSHGRATEEMEFSTITIDNCEYLTSSPGWQTGLFTHKGNCKFCRERRIRGIY